MRRIVSYGLLGLGVFAVALGLLLRLNTYPQLAKVKLDVDTVSVASGSEMTALVFVNQASGASLPEIKTGLELTASRWVKGDLTQPEVVDGGDVATWIESVEVVDQDGNRVRATLRELCVNRHTNEAHEPCTGQFVQTKLDPQNEPIRENGVAQPGLNFKFPFGTEARSYRMYDLTLRDAAEARFDGEEQIDGLDLFRFVQDIPPTKIDARKVPGSLINDSASVVDVDLYYQNKRTMWVEPTTGQVVKGQEEQLQELRKPSQGAGDGTAVFKGTLLFTEQTVKGNVAEAKDNKSQLWLLTTLPVILWVVGGALILGAVALLYFWHGGRGKLPHNPGPPPQQRQRADATR